MRVRGGLQLRQSRPGSTRRVRGRRMQLVGMRMSRRINNWSCDRHLAIGPELIRGRGRGLSLSWLPKIALSPYFFFRESTISTFSYLVSVSGRSQSGIMPNAKADVARHLGHPETKTAHRPIPRCTPTRTYHDELSTRQQYHPRKYKRGMPTLARMRRDPY